MIMLSRHTDMTSRLTPQNAFHFYKINVAHHNDHQPVTHFNKVLLLSLTLVLCLMHIMQQAVVI